jgi:alpha-L-fucosidase
VGGAVAADRPTPQKAGPRGAQRLSVERLRQFEALRYGMFISYDIQAFYPGTIHGKVTPEKRCIPPTRYAPDKLDVGQWISVARDAGMKYAVLTAKRHPGFCLWPSKHTDYTVANSGNKTDVVAGYVKACRQRGVQPGLYYPAVDFHHLGGRRPEDDWKYTTSIHQTFITNQITELLSNYGPIAEVWIDIPHVLGRGYRTFLYEHIARLQPNAVVLMNGGFHDGSQLPTDRIWPTDLVSLERTLPAQGGYSPWKTVEGQPYYLPGEFCDSIKPSWWWVEGEEPRDDAKVLAQFQACRRAGVNFLLDAPPDNHGLIPATTIAALQRLRRAMGSELES